MKLLAAAMSDSPLPTQSWGYNSQSTHHTRSEPA